MIHTYQEKY